MTIVQTRIVDELAGLDLNRDLSWTLLEAPVVAHAGEGDVDRVVQLLADALDQYGTEFFVSVARKGGAAAALVARLQSSGAYR